MTLPRFVLDDLAEAVGAVGDTLDDASALRRAAPALVDDPAALAVRIGLEIHAAPDVRLLDRLAEDGPALAPVPETTASRRAQARSVEILEALVQRLAAVEVASRSARAEYADRRAVIVARDRALDLLDMASADAGDALYTAIRDLRAALIEHLAARAPSLARIVETEEFAGLPSLVAAHRLFDDAALADDVAERAGAIRPGFLPGGPIEVAIRD